jgi:D-alanyl-D-alanine carboxypeptidase/D-alanyl-D-alanine-endopeptidase (penicillin-binding protein 4)
MTRSRWVALLLLFTFFIQPAAEGAKKRRRPARRKAPAVPVDAATGTTLEERLASLVNGNVARSSEASVQVVDLATGAVVVEKNPNLPLAPASNMKLFTTAAGFDLLTPKFEIRTTVYVRGTVDPNGTLEGDVKIVGRGDPTIGGRFHDGHATAVIDEWVSDLKRAGTSIRPGR